MASGGTLKEAGFVREKRRQHGLKEAVTTG